MAMPGPLARFPLEKKPTGDLHGLPAEHDYL